MIRLKFRLLTRKRFQSAFIFRFLYNAHMSSILSVKDLTKIYGKKTPITAVDRIQFHLKPGEILGLLGPNGSGKTTTIQMLLGTLTKTSGQIEYFGKDFEKHRTSVLEKISFASTYLSLPYILTIKENLEVIGLLYGLSKKESYQRFMPLLERFGVEKYLHTRICSLSAGQVTRLMMVKAFFVRPKIVLLDEPTASLDPEISSDICDFLLEERKKENLSILFTSHKMEEVAKVCDRVIFLSKGKVIADDLPSNLARQNGNFRVRLVILEDLAKAVAISKERNLPCLSDEKKLEVEMEEKEIPGFLQKLSLEKIVYSSIQIQEPSLQDYFLKIARDRS